MAGQRLSTDLDAALDIFCQEAQLALKRFCEDLEISAERFCREIGRAKNATNRNLEEGMELFKAKQDRTVRSFCSELDLAVAQLKKSTNRALEEFNTDIGRALEALLDDSVLNLTIKIPVVPPKGGITGVDDLSTKSLHLKGHPCLHTQNTLNKHSEI